MSAPPGTETAATDLVDLHRRKAATRWLDRETVTASRTAGPARSLHCTRGPQHGRHSAQRAPAEDEEWYGR
jgi:hypothetical protein